MALEAEWVCLGRVLYIPLIVSPHASFTVMHFPRMLLSSTSASYMVHQFQITPRSVGQLSTKADLSHLNLRATKGSGAHGTHPLRFFDVTLFASGIKF